jgi:hypothetical protein
VIGSEALGGGTSRRKTSSSVLANSSTYAARSGVREILNSIFYQNRTGHYDHLDMATIRALAALQPALVVPLGVGEHLGRDSRAVC